MKRWLELGLLAVIIVAVGLALMEAMGWALAARIFPVSVAVPLLVLAVAQLVVTARRREAVAQAAVEGPAAYIEATSLVPASVARVRVARLIGWFGVFLLAIWLFSFPLGLSLGVLLYVKFEGERSWLLAAILAGASYAYMYGLFDYALHIPWPRGVVMELLFPQ